jgi:hypothetical protein
MGKSFDFQRGLAKTILASPAWGSPASVNVVFARMFFASG